jgi:glycosyltransferase involved in cell wall biosynthesis
MIVRNECRVIKRCLESVKPLIDHWVIVDTGSRDGTQEIIRETMKGIPGELHERPWLNFAHNRTEALTLAKGHGEFALLIDADEELIYEKDFVVPDFSEQVYIIYIRYDTVVFHRELFVNNELDWYWEGLLHEQIHCKQKLHRVAVMQKMYNLSKAEGQRSLDPQKYEKDAALLEAALETDPNNSRYVFYLAQSYACQKNWRKAMAAYERRSQMGGWNQEVYYSLYAHAYMQDQLKLEPHTIIDAYAKAYQYRPSRSEGLFRIACIYFNLNHFALAKIVTKYGMGGPLSKDSMFVEPAIYQFGLMMLNADCCRALDEVEGAIQGYENVLKVQELPKEVRSDVERNIAQLKARPRTVPEPDMLPFC